MVLRSLVSVVVAVAAAVVVVASAGEGYGECWTYNTSDAAGQQQLHGPDEWAACAAACGGHAQSPVNIDLIHVRQTTTALRALSFACPAARWELRNTGATLAATPAAADECVLVDGLGETFRMAGVHWHWARDSVLGAEHAIAGRREAAEAHFVHCRAGFASLDDALASGEQGAVAVVAVHFRPSLLAQNAALDAVLRHAADKLANATDSAAANATDFAPWDMLATGADSLDYLMYNGSLTTPGCNEGVRWYVLQKVAPISFAQLAALRTLRHDNGTLALPDFASNARPFQPLNNRTVLAYPRLHALGTALDEESATVAAVVLALGCVGTLATLAVFAAILLRKK